MRAFRTTTILLAAIAATATCTAGLVTSGAVGGPSHPSADASVDEAGLRGTMIGGNTYGDQVREAQPRADGYRHIDTPKLIARLERANANLYLFQIWNSPTDWQDLTEEFAPAAQEAGIQVWPYIVPPSECQYYDADGDPLPPLQRGRCSQPYGLDYVRWAEEVAKLSARYPVVSGWAIDDFHLGQNGQTFTPEYMQRMEDAQDAIKPGLEFYTTAYLNAATDDTFLAKYAPYISGIIYPYLGISQNLVDASEVGQTVDMIEPHTDAYGLDVMFLMYTNRFVGPQPHPNDRYIDAMLDAVRPRIADGQLRGVIAYGMPMDGTPALNSDADARNGVGRLSLSVSSFAPAGSTASASQTITVHPQAQRQSLTFWHSDWWARTPTGFDGFHSKQLLVDDQVVWDSDIMDDNIDEWTKTTVDLTQALRGKTEATLTFRLLERRAVSSFPVDVRIDDVEADGFTLENGGFESLGAWELAKTGQGVKPLIDVWSADMQQRIAHAVATHYALMAGVNPPDYDAKQSPPPENPRSMYGRGRLSLSVGNYAATQAEQCASASQTVTPAPSPRYELSFWHNDWWMAPAMSGHHHKQVLVDGVLVFDTDVSDAFGWSDWTQGAPLQGPIDVTTLVAGKSAVTITFRLCETAAVTDLPVDVGFDNVTTVGLPLENPGFDNDTGWTLRSEGNVRATIDNNKSQETEPLPVVARLPEQVPYTDAGSVSVPVDVTNTSPLPTTDVTVRLTLPGAIVQPEMVSVDQLDAGEADTVTFDLSLPDGTGARIVEPTVTVTWRGQGKPEEWSATPPLGLTCAAEPTSPVAVTYVDSEETVGSDGAAENAIDSDPNTIWHTEWSAANPPHPHEIQVDLGQEMSLCAFRYLPRQDHPNGTVAEYELYLSADGTSWGDPVAAGTIPAGLGDRWVPFADTTARYVRFVALSEINGNPWTAAAELSVDARSTERAH
jgi:hypothetical protein